MTPKAIVFHCLECDTLQSLPAYDDLLDYYGWDGYALDCEDMPSYCTKCDEEMSCIISCLYKKEAVK